LESGFVLLNETDASTVGVAQEDDRTGLLQLEDASGVVLNETPASISLLLEGSVNTQTHDNIRLEGATGDLILEVLPSGSSDITSQFSSAGVAVEKFTGSGSSSVVLADSGAGVEVFTGTGTDFLVLADDGAGFAGPYGSGSSFIVLADAGAGFAGPYGSGSSVIVLEDAGAGVETFIGSGASFIVFADAGEGQVPITGDGESFIGFVSVGDGHVPVPRLFVLGGAGPRRAATPKRVLPEPQVYATVEVEEAPDVEPYVAVTPITTPEYETVWTMQYAAWAPIAKNIRKKVSKQKAAEVAAHD